MDARSVIFDFRIMRMTGGWWGICADLLEKLHFCPNDVFFAMSHGVHRGVLKGGKNDDREKLISNTETIKLYLLNAEIKILNESN